MAKRRASRVVFTVGTISAIVATCIILFTLQAGWKWPQALVLLIGSLVLVWAILFSFMELRRVATGSPAITGPREEFDPDAPRRVTVRPPTGNPEPHHEHYPESPGQDQGQLTSRLEGTPSLREMLRRRGESNEPVEVNRSETSGDRSDAPRTP